MRFDIDALFKHMTDTLSWDVSEPLHWAFSFTSGNAEKLAEMGETMADEFEVSMPEVVDLSSGTERPGPPTLELAVEGVLDARDVKSLAHRFAALAKQEGVTYTGATCREIIDEEALWGWLDMDDALWRLRVFEEAGLAQGERVPFVFAFESEDESKLEAAADLLNDEGVEALELVEPDDEGEGEDDAEPLPLLIAYMEGVNNDDALKAKFRSMERVAAKAGITLRGMQFFEAEEMSDEEE
jgi:hypothetical protein